MPKIDVKKKEEPKAAETPATEAVEIDDYECASCDRKISKDQKFCPSCGGELIWTA